nr:hypothetical protein [Chryseobacterium taklimakanense]
MEMPAENIPKKASKNQTVLTHETLMLKYFPIPAQTPAILLLAMSRDNFGFMLA